MVRLNPQRVTLITLGVDDLARSREFYKALGWLPAEELPEVTFFRLRGFMLGLYGRDALAREQGRLGAGLGTGAHVTRPEFSIRGGCRCSVCRSIVGWRRTLEAAGKSILGRLLRILRRPGRPCLGGCPQPVLATRRGRISGSVMK